MIPKRAQILFYVIVILLTLLSCQKRNSPNKKEAYNKAKADKLIAVADTLFDNNKFDSAFYYYNEAIFVCSPIKDAENYISTLNRMAIIQQTHGDFAGSEATITKALPYAKYVKNKLHTWNLYVTLSVNYLDTYDYKSAILYNEKALQLDTKNWRKLAAKNNIGVALIQEKKYYEALTIFLPLETKDEIVKDKDIYGSLLDNIGFCYFKIDAPKKGLEYMNRALEVRQDAQNPFGLGKSYMHLAEFYQQRDLSLSKKYILLSYKEYSKINYIDGRLSALKMIINNSNNNELKEYSNLYIALSDSIDEVRQKAKNQFAKIKYDSKREKEENLKLKAHKAENELDLERQKNRNIISYIIVILSLCLILILYYYLTSKANRDKIEAAYNSETRISKKLHDELANDIYHTMAFAENKNLSLLENKEQLLNSLDTIYSRTRDIARENCTISTDGNYVLSIKEMISGFNTPNINLLINGLDTISWHEIDKAKKTAIYRAIQELLVNMKKHSEASLVAIIFKETNKDITINYTDNGKGIDVTKMVLKNGLHNIENRILAIKGKINIESDLGKGFKVFIKFPL
ncbi:ATP-binding protein [Flavobacterium sp. ACN6]|uniref:tetratricopeptide repeat-containing sensor histidine kinase n=1 Tax=Flavobacterium sp. ACN6 TaxID=1920426 RepID=UPI000BB38719|nr:ATP-binding protein [Flavobacterium sp. ACN6]PBJ13591.1 Sensor histidine kinase ComP [Flavobacterium sp. ACN6]